MSILSDIERLITEHGSAAILRERLALIADQAKALEKQIEDLKRKVAALEQEKSRLNAELAAKTREEQFVEHRGALFKRKREGGYHLAVYCAICHKPTTSLYHTPYACTDKCGWIATFSDQELKNVI